MLAGSKNDTLAFYYGINVAVAIVIKMILALEAFKSYASVMYVVSNKVGGTLFLKAMESVKGENQ